MPGLPFTRAEVLTSHSCYGEARDTLSRLVEAGIPPQRIAIVGSRLEPATPTAEHFLGVAFAGLAAGAWIGAIAGASVSLVGFPSPSLPFSLGLTLWTGMSGAVSGLWLGAIAALGWHRMSRRQLRVTRYDVVAHADVAARGRAELQRRRFVQRARPRRAAALAAGDRGRNA